MLPKLAFTCKFFSYIQHLHLEVCISETTQQWAAYLISASLPTHIIVNILNILGHLH